MLFVSLLSLIDSATKVALGITALQQEVLMETILQELTSAIEVVDLSTAVDPLADRSDRETDQVIGDMSEYLKRVLVVLMQYAKAMSDAESALRHLQIDAENDSSLKDQLAQARIAYHTAKSQYEVAERLMWAEIYREHPILFKQSKIIILSGWRVGWEKRSDHGFPSGAFLVVERPFPSPKA
ncbi:hypothetical protein ACFL0L_05130 [Patescibacteria group bacterium]